MIAGASPRPTFSIRPFSAVSALSAPSALKRTEEGHGRHEKSLCLASYLRNLRNLRIPGLSLSLDDNRPWR
jgi:hypothetical protein